MSKYCPYTFLRHIDAAKRILTLTLDEMAVAVLGFFMLIMASQKIVVALVSFGLLTSLRMLKKGASPRVLLVLAYWYLPHKITQCFLPRLPASHHRVWLA